MQVYNLGGEVVNISREALSGMCHGENDGRAAYLGPGAVSRWQLEKHIEEIVQWKHGGKAMYACIFEDDSRLGKYVPVEALVDDRRTFVYFLEEVGVVHTTDHAFCAVRQVDGALVAWGESDFGGDSSGVQSLLDGDVAAIYSNSAAFCAVRKSDGAVVTWGHRGSGGDSSAVREQLLGDVGDIYATAFAFCAVTKKEGRIVTWGNAENGGDSAAVQEELRGDVAAIYFTDSAFCAVKKSNGGIVAWGHEYYGGGDCSRVADELRGDVASIHSTSASFCAVKKSDGDIVQWGTSDASAEDDFFGGDLVRFADPPLSEAAIASEWHTRRCATAALKLRGNVSAMYSTELAFCAVRRSDGGIITWGDRRQGADCSSAVQERLRGDIAAIYTSWGTFCAVRKSDGGIVTWGDNGRADCSSVEDELRGDVGAIYSTRTMFCAVKKSDGQMVFWRHGGGEVVFGGVVEDLQGDVAAIYTNESSFCAVKKSDGGIVEFGRVGAESRVSCWKVAAGVKARDFGWRHRVVEVWGGSTAETQETERKAEEERYNELLQKYPEEGGFSKRRRNDL
jgi:hypothetical protein